MFYSNIKYIVLLLIKKILNILLIIYSANYSYQKKNIIVLLYEMYNDLLYLDINYVYLFFHFSMNCVEMKTFQTACYINSGSNSTGSNIKYTS